MNELPPAAALSYDPAQAVAYGQFIETVYTMYGKDEANPTPAPPSPFLSGYQFVAWVQMKDFIFESGDWTFYGLIAQSTSNINEFVLAIRGTSNLTEWWDDLTSMALVPMTDFGQVGYGFQRIYQTLRVVHPEPAATAAPGVAARAQSLESVGTFADQVAAAVQRHVAAERPTDMAAPLMSITVTGHSLGAALATLYVAQNSLTHKVVTPLLCTFASPRVGDPEFADKFDGLGIASWRIVNELDIVPKLPFLGFQHVATEHDYNSGWQVVWSLPCWHSLETYLHLLDPKQPLLPACVWSAKVAAAAPLRAPGVLAHPAAVAPATVAPPVAALPAAAATEIAIPAPAAGTTINITIKIG